MEPAGTMAQGHDPVIVNFDDLRTSSIPFDTLEEAFGTDSLGILIVEGLPKKYQELRLKALSYASYLANLPKNELDVLSSPSTKYLTGWSHGKEALKNGSYDTLKGSYYVNCAFYQGEGVTVTPSKDFPEFTGQNIWPSEKSLPGFRKILEELCTLIIDTAVLVARACDRYAEAKIDAYESGYLEHVVKTSTITKARLLHYFPQLPSAEAIGKNGAKTNVSISEWTSHDDWCATHVDHGCLTGLCSAMYVNEAECFPSLTESDSPSAPSSLPNLPELGSPPDPETGLYIHARDQTISKVSIPPECLAFQTGEALEVITGGKFRAVPHFVRAGGRSKEARSVARNTLAVFTQPELDAIVDKVKDTTFGSFSRDVVGRFG